MHAISCFELIAFDDRVWVMTRVLHKLDDKNMTAKFVIVRVKKGDNVMLKVFDGDLQLTVSVMFTLERSL